MTAATSLNLSAYSPASSFLDALNRREISARELLDAHLRRRERIDPGLNSIILLDAEGAQAAATKADKRRAAGDNAPLLGLPITVKESVDVQGMASTAGVDFRKSHRAARDAQTVQALRDAGAVIVGKTNVCLWLQDFQADNPLYGRTNNPWNPALTPGGSSGGSATLAGGLIPLDWGSDLAGSIRVPAAFCGLWGHKPSQGIVPNTGHFPGSDFPNPATNLAMQGPQARGAADLELALNVTLGLDQTLRPGWQLQLPPCRHQSLRDFRIAILPRLPWLEVDTEILDAIDRLANALSKLGAAVVEAPIEFLKDGREHYALFRSIMRSIISTNWPAERRESVAKEALARGEEFHAADARGLRASAGELIRWMDHREAFRAAWLHFFERFDVLITPITLGPAFPHTQAPNGDRRLKINGRDVEFEYMSFYPSIASLAGLPATAIPAGFNSAGLPLGVQVVGPLFGDLTTIGFSRLMEQATGSFVPPRAFDADLS